MSHLQSQRLLNRTCVISGGANGIGAAIAELFFEHGCRVAILDIAEFDNVKSCIESKMKLDSKLNNNNVLYIQCDIRKEDQVSKSISLVYNKFGEIDILVNNAARFILKSSMDAKLQDWKDSIEVNILGHVNMVKYCVPKMNHKSKKSSIVYIASVSSILAQPKMITYSVTKAAILALNRNNALDLYQKYGIRVNAILPGAIYTKASDNEMKIQGWTKKEWEKIKTENTIMKRIGNVKEVAMAALFFASDDSSYTTGTTLLVDGGAASHL